MMLALDGGRSAPESDPATMNDEGLADAKAASPFRLPRLHPGIGLTPGAVALR
jgi:hypothetical protein